MNPKAFQLFDQHFEIYGDRFEYSNVQSIRWLATERMKFIYFIPVGVDRTYELLIHFLEGAPLSLGTGALPIALPFGLREPDFRELSSKMQKLLASTYAYRLVQYREQLQRSECFEYDGKRFYMDGSVEVNGRKRVIDFATPARAQATRTQLKCLPSGSIEVGTFWDRDCFHSLLNQIHGARAKN